jgi:hypothetical protein
MNHETKLKRPRVITAAAWLARLILCASVLNGLCASPVAPQSQQQPLLFCRGKVVEFKVPTLLLDVGGKPPRREFTLAQQAKLVDEVHVNDSVNAAYVKKGGQDIVVVLQRLPDIVFDDEKRGKEEPMGVSDLVMPAPLSARIFAAVGGSDIVARLPWPLGGETTGGVVIQASSCGAQGVVVSVTRSNPFESALRLYKDERIFILDPLTRIVGHLKAGTSVDVETRDCDTNYANEVRVK